MRLYLLAALLGAALVSGCGSGSTSLDQAATEPMADAGFGRQIDIPPAPEGAGTETYTNLGYQFRIDYPSQQFAAFDPPVYANTANRVFELVQRTLPAGDIFRPNVGLIVDARFEGTGTDVAQYVSGAPQILGAFFENFQLLGQQAITTADGRPAQLIEYTATWRAPNGTAVDFHRINVYTVNDAGLVLIFTHTATPQTFPAVRDTFLSIANSIHLL